MSGRAARGLRLLALPVGQSRTAPSKAPDWIYLHPLLPPQSTAAPTDSIEKPSRLNRAITYASDTWNGWGRADGGWKKKVYSAGEKAMDQISYEEWALKSLEPSKGPKPWTNDTSESGRRLSGPADGAEISSLPREKTATLSDPPRQGSVPILYPASLMTESAGRKLLESIATEKQSYHGKWKWICGLSTPLTFPFALVPVIPNLPLFYLIWRTWSHYKADKSAAYIESLLGAGQILYEPSPVLDQIYAEGSSSSKTAADTQPGRLLLEQKTLDILVERMGLSSQAKIELRRAMHQVQQQLKAQSASEPALSAAPSGDASQSTK